YYSRSEGDLAELLVRRALAGSEAHLGEDHADVADTLNNLARLCFRKQDYATAEPLLKRLLAVKEKVTGPDHPEVAGILMSLVKVRFAAGQFEAADALCRRALQIRESHLASDDPALGQTLDSLAEICAARKNVEEELDLRRRSLHIKQQALGSDHPSVRATLSAIESLAMRLGTVADLTSGAAPPQAAAHTPRPIALVVPFPEPVSAPRPEARSGPRPEPRSRPRPEHRSGPRPEPRSGPRPEPKTAPRPEPVSAPRPAPITAIRPEPVSAPRPASLSVRPEPVSAPRPEPVSAPRLAPITALSEPLGTPVAPPSLVTDEAFGDFLERAEATRPRSYGAPVTPPRAQTPSLPLPSLTDLRAVSPLRVHAYQDDPEPDPFTSRDYAAFPSRNKWKYGAAAAAAIAVVAGWLLFAGGLSGRTTKQGSASPRQPGASAPTRASSGARETVQPGVHTDSVRRSGAGPLSRPAEPEPRSTAAVVRGASAASDDVSLGNARPHLEAAGSPARTDPPPLTLPKLDIRVPGMDKITRNIEESAKARLDSLSRINVKPPTFQNRPVSQPPSK
ncbi:MAG: tetratricopeptide repeat protein, partial [Gemmatimonadaceae bacterium]